MVSVQFGRVVVGLIQTGMRVSSSTKAIVQAAERLSSAEFDALVDALLLLRGRRRAVASDDLEAGLLRGIDRSRPTAALERRERLSGLAREREWTSEEREEFVRLTEVIETAEASRLELLARLSELRGCSVRETAGELGLLRD